jgi:hypothetical protein
MVLKGNHGVFNSTVAVHGTFSKIDHILRHKASLNKYRKIEITPLHTV